MKEVGEGSLQPRVDSLINNRKPCRGAKNASHGYVNPGMQCSAIFFRERPGVGLIRVHHCTIQFSQPE